MSSAIPLGPQSASALIASALKALGIEARAVQALMPRIGDSFAEACRLCLECRGRVVVTGMGKSGHIARKVLMDVKSGRVFLKNIPRPGTEKEAGDNGRRFLRGFMIEA